MAVVVVMVATAVIDALASVETAYQQRSLKQHASALAAITASIEQHERTAATVLAG